MYCTILCIHTFQSTPSVWRETPSASAWRTASKISIHSLRMEGDSTYVSEPLTLLNFNPLPPYGGRHHQIVIIIQFWDFNPLPPYGGRQKKRISEIQQKMISIHSLRMEGDPRFHNPQTIACNFNPLPPYGGRRTTVSQMPWRKIISIHSLRMEGDQARPARSCQALHFNPLPPYGGRHLLGRVEDDNAEFQSTPSVWRETGRLPAVLDLDFISIHSLRMEGDHTSGTSLWKSPYFNPLPPYGGRPY